MNTWVTLLCGVAGVLNICATLVLNEAGYLCTMKLANTRGTLVLRGVAGMLNTCVTLVLCVVWSW